MKWLLIAILVGVTPFPANAKSGFTPPQFWEPDLPDDQEFITLWRAVKSFGLSRYDLLHEGEEYPVTELIVELTHSRVRFIAIEKSKGRPIPLNLREIAEGKFDEHGGFSKREPGLPPPPELTKSRRKPQSYSCFVLNSPKDVEELYESLSHTFRLSFPW